MDPAVKLEPLENDIQFQGINNSFESVKSEVTSQTSIKIFNCVLCNYSTNDRGNFKRHQQSKHESMVKSEISAGLTKEAVGLEEKPSLSDNIPCQFCDFQTESKSAMIIHVQTLHTEISLDVSNLKSCKFCPFTTTCRKQFKIHKKTEHMELLKVNSCDECTFQTTSDEGFKLHKKFHGEMKDCPGVKCEYCEYIYKHDPADKKGMRKCKMRLNEHMNDEHTEFKLKCEKCEKAFWTQQQLKVHTMRHENTSDNGTSIKIFNCYSCEYSTNDRGNFKRHQQSKHENLVVKNEIDIQSSNGTTVYDVKPNISHNIPCQFCDFETESKSLMINHVKTAHTEVCLDVSNIKSCKFCSFTTSCRKEFKLHRKTEHTELLKVNSCEECTYQTTSEEGFKLHKKFHGVMKDCPGVKCDYCEYIYKHDPADEKGLRKCKMRLNEHMNDEHAEFKLKCNQCEKTVWTQQQLKVHMMRHEHTTESGTLTCDKCGYMCKSAHRLKLHIDAVHLGVRKHLCDWCPAAFATTSALNKHILSHTDERNFKCQFCEKAFHSKGNLQTHIRTHTGEKPFTCDICGKSFSDQSYLGKHKRLHDTSLSGAPLKDFLCELCNKGFTKKSYLQNHLATHQHQNDGAPAKYTNEFKMEAVMKAKAEGLHKAAIEMFVNKNTLKNWLRLSVHPHICNICGKAFSYEAQLKRHINTHPSTEDIGEKSIRYEADFKQEVAQFAMENSIQEAIKRFQLPHSTINNWLRRISNPQICQLCGKPFANRAAVRRHIEQVHKNTPEGAEELLKRSEEIQNSQTFSEFLAHHDLLPSQEQIMELSMDKERKKREKEELAILAKEIMYRVKEEEVAIKDEDMTEDPHTDIFSPITCLDVFEDPKDVSKI